MHNNYNFKFIHKILNPKKLKTYQGHYGMLACTYAKLIT